MVVTIRDREVAIVSRSCKDDKKIAAFLAVALRYAEQYARELDLPSTAKEYQEVADQLSELI